MTERGMMKTRLYEETPIFVFSRQQRKLLSPYNMGLFETSLLSYQSIHNRFTAFTDTAHGSLLTYIASELYNNNLLIV